MSDDAAPQTNTQQTPPADNQPVLPEKFKSEDDFKASFTHLVEKQGLSDVVPSEYENLESQVAMYRKLEKRQSQNTPTDDSPMQLPQQTQTNADDYNIAKVLETAGLNHEQLAESFAKDGSLSDEDYSKIQANHPLLKDLAPEAAKALTDQFITGEFAKSEVAKTRNAEARQRAAGLAGGVDELDTLLVWGGQNITDPDTRADIDARLKNPKQFEGAIKLLLYEYQKATGSDKVKPLVNNTHQSPPSGGAKPFRDRAELNEMKNDKRMRTDPEFEKRFNERLLATPDEVMNPFVRR